MSAPRPSRQRGTYEVDVVGHRLLQAEAVHGMQPGDEEELPNLLNQQQGLMPPHRQAKRTTEEQQKREDIINEEEAVDEAFKEAAKDNILQSKSIIAMFDTAVEWIDEDWIGTIDELPGNIYRIGALGTFTVNFDDDPSVTLQAFVRILGCLSIVVVQILGPPAIFLSTFFAWGVQAENIIHWAEWEPSLSDWAHIKLTKILASVFLFAFTINGLYVLLQEKQSWQKIYMTFRYLKHKTPNMDVTGEWYLMAGALINMWVVLWCCLDSFVVLGASFSPRNVLFDALGLLFLYNLDDIDGDLGFVGLDDWDGVRLGWIYEEMVKPNYCSADDPPEAEDFDPQELPCKAMVIVRLYEVTAACLAFGSIAMPIMAAITPFLDITPDEFE